MLLINDKWPVMITANCDDWSMIQLYCKLHPLTILSITSNNESKIKPNSTLTAAEFMWVESHKFHIELKTQKDILTQPQLCWAWPSLLFQFNTFYLISTVLLPFSFMNLRKLEVHKTWRIRIFSKLDLGFLVKKLWGWNRKSTFL